MPAPGTRDTIPGVINTVAGFFNLIAKNSPKSPTKKAPKKVPATLLLKLCIKIYRITQDNPPDIPEAITELRGALKYIANPIVAKKENIS